MYDFQPCSKEVVGLTDSLIKYIEVVKDGTSLEIGLYIYASSFLDYYADPQYPCKFSLNVNSCIIYYIILYTVLYIINCI